MNCKTLFDGSLSLDKLKKTSPFVRHCICASLWDHADKFGLTESQSFKTLYLWRDPLSLFLFLRDLRITSITVVEQYPGGRLFSPYRCNAVVTFYLSVYTTTFVSKK